MLTESRLPLTGMLLAALLLACATAVVAGDRPRVVTLAPHLTELVFTAGSGETLVGVVDYSDWPEQARELPLIGDAFRFDMETILGLNVDLALAWTGGTPAAVANRLEQLGVEVMWVGTRTLNDIGSALEQIGKRLGSADQAQKAARDFRAELKKLRAGHGGNGDGDVSIFYQVSARPLFTLGKSHVITEVFEVCGARNVFDDINSEAASIDREAVIARAPELIIASLPESGEDPLTIWRHTRMVEKGQTRLEAVEPERLVRPTPRIADGIRYVCGLVEELEAKAGSETTPDG